MANDANANAGWISANGLYFGEADAVAWFIVDVGMHGPTGQHALSLKSGLLGADLLLDNLRLIPAKPTRPVQSGGMSIKNDSRQNLWSR